MQIKIEKSGQPRPGVDKNEDKSPYGGQGANIQSINDGGGWKSGVVLSAGYANIQYAIINMSITGAG